MIADPATDMSVLLRELLRIDTSVVGLFRYVATDTTIAGVAVPGGSALWAAFAAANRDPSVYPDADRFIPGRAIDRPTLTFGLGAHYCLGRALAETQTVIALKALVSMLPDAKLAAPTFEVPNHLLRITPVLLVSK